MGLKFSTRLCRLSRAIPYITAGISAFLLLQAALREGQAEADSLTSAGQLANLSFEDLMQIEVFSASKQAETVFTTASAIFVITSEDILKSGVNSLPEALRLAPGVQVAKIDGDKWAVSIRGFSGRFTNKLLVLQDGRTLDNPLFSGTYWNAQEIMLEDIERIEIIRGPAATLWGANAVNGVINITTKHAKDTQGGLVTASYGTAERAATGIRYGGKIGENGYLRAYGKFFDRDIQLDTGSTFMDSKWKDYRSGFRGDWDFNSKNSITLQGDLYEGPADTAVYSGQNLLGRWSNTISDTSNLSLQIYYDRTSVKDKNDPELKMHEARNTGDIELQHSFAIGDSQNIVWGTGYRLISDQMNNDPTINPAFIPASRTDRLFTAFINDKITLWPETVRLILGSRAEHNDTTGWEIQPTARLLITPSEQHSLWAAVSRAVRTPSRAETTI